jgi:ABC-2 type transport system ATP-binding protein
MNMGIRIRNVTKTFGVTRALDGVSLNLTEGRIYGLLGNNGAGKTTLLNIMTNRLYANSGEVLIDDEPVSDNDRALGKVFLIGELNLYPDDMRVSKAFTVTKLFHPAFDTQYARELARRFGLNIKSKITALSTGYASIFRLIVALSVNTPYLLLDEPTLGLDAQHRDMFYKLLIEKYSENQCTILISTHLIQEVANLIEHTLIIKNGRIIKDMPREELLNSAYTVSGPAALVSSYISGREVLSVNNLGGLKTACIQGKAERDGLPAGLELGTLSLQDYFISLINEEETK